MRDMHVRLVYASAISFVIFPCWQACTLASSSLLLHCLHMSSPKGGRSQPAITLPPATSTKGQYLQGLQR